MHDGPDIRQSNNKLNIRHLIIISIRFYNHSNMVLLISINYLYNILSIILPNWNEFNETS